jgi:hypothetical protein
VQSSCENRPVKFQVRSRPPIFVPQQEAPQQSENESLQLAFEVAEKEKIRWCYIWGIWQMLGKSGFSLRHKVEDGFGSVAPRIISVND